MRRDTTTGALQGLIASQLVLLERLLIVLSVAERALPHRDVHPGMCALEADEPKLGSGPWWDGAPTLAYTYDHQYNLRKRWCPPGVFRSRVVGSYRCGPEGGRGSVGREGR